jgi:colanic acid biosynthesis glycosyl transferase WcaI
MRILILTINYWPEQTGIGAVMTRRCEYLASVGHDVTVCTGMPYYPEWRIHSSYRRKPFLWEKRNGVNILRSWLWVPKKVTSAKRVLFEASFVASSLLQVLRCRKPELLQVISPPLGLGLSAVLLSRWLKIPYVFDVQDLQPDAAADLGMLPRPLLPMLYRLEAVAYQNASLISTVTNSMRKKIIAKGFPPNKVIVIPPPADDSLFDVGRIVDDHRFRREYNLIGKFVVAHSGNMGIKQDLNVVLDTAVQLKTQSDVLFLLAGDGAAKPNLERRVALLELPNIRFLPVQEQSQFLEMLAAIDLALIVQHASVSDIVFPSKTVTLLSAARPVGAAVNETSEIASVIRESGGGIVSPSGNVKSLTETIQQFSKDRRKGRAMGESGRRYALRHWNEARIFSNLESHLMSVCGTPADKVT